MKVIIAASECVPFIKTGGLADVVGALPAAEKELGAEVSVMIPKYSRIPERFRFNMEHVTDFYITLGWRSQYVGVDRLMIDGVNYYFLDNEYYFKQDYVYTDGDFETERFCWFCRAVLEAMLRLDIVPDVLHLNDWQTGLIAMLLNEQYRHNPAFRDVKTVYTIHNLRYQGLMSPLLVNDLLSLGQYALSKIEYYCFANAMKAGIVYADAVSTVSPTYAREITTPAYGETLDGLLSSRGDGVTGILNGIDRKSYNPWTDKALPARFSKNSIRGKAKCKAELQKELELEQNPDAPVLAVISRLTNQKGLDLVNAVIPGLMDLGAQVVILGMGDAWLERQFNDLSHSDYGRGRVAFRCEMNDGLARRIYAGADLFLMPSAFEPCGLSQMFSLRYGCLPVVRETGGLADSVIPYNKFTDEGNGFSFRNYSATELYNACREAIDLYRWNRPTWDRMVKRAMETDLGWGESAKKYLELYSRISGK